MIIEGHLAAAQQAIAEPSAAQAPRANYGLAEQLLVRPQWIEENAPRLSEFSAGALVLAASGQHATRSIVALNADGEEVHGEVEYDVPPANVESASSAKLRHEMHWQREATAIRALDTDAAGEHRAKRAKQRCDEREHEDTVADVLERVISGREVRSSNTISTYTRGLEATAAERRAAHDMDADQREEFLWTWDGIVEPMLFFMNTSQRARQSSLVTIASTAATWTCTTLRQTLSQRDAGIGTASLSTLSVTWPAYASAAAAAATAAISRGRLCVWMYRVPACWLHQGQLRELLHRLHHG